MATMIPYIAMSNVVLAASGTGVLSYAVSQTWIFHAHTILFKAAGAFRINQITDSNGINYTNATASNPIPSNFLQDPTSSSLSLREFLGELLLKGGQTITFNVTDTSAAPNTITLLINANVEYP